MSRKLWEFEKKEPTEEVKTNLPDNHVFLIYRVTSGDSGEKYWVQLLMDKKSKTVYANCDCPKGKFQWPLATLGLEPHFCKHIQATLEISNLR